MYLKILSQVFNRSVIFLIPVILLSGCFEVIEEITLNDDGSGKFEYTINLSQSKTRLASIMLMDSINGYKVPKKEDITKLIDQVVDAANATEGISEVSSEKDFQNFIFTLKCNFEDVSNINDLLKELKRISKLDNSVNPDDDHFVYDPAMRVFKRNNNYNINKEYQKLKQADREIFDNAYYISINRFQSSVVSYDNNSAILSPTKKAVMLKIKAMDLIQGEKNIANKIQLSN